MRPVPTFARKASSGFDQGDGWCMEWFLEAELLVNITEHVLVPHHQTLSKEVLPAKQAVSRLQTFF